MEYKLRGNYSEDPKIFMKEILHDRHVTNISKYISPDESCEHDPLLLDNIMLGATTLLKFLKKDAKITILVDADCDGYTSSSILWNYIKEIYPEAKLSFIVHEHKQHGLESCIDEILSMDIDLLLVPDAGSFDGDYFQQLLNANITTIILDHHQCPDGYSVSESTPDNVIIINNQLSEKYPNKFLCGAGVVYKFCEVLDQVLDVSKAKNYIDLVAIGEISDVMFQGEEETRYLIIEGLRNIRNEGLIAMINAQSYSLKNKAIPPYNTLTPIDVAFYIGPLINAVTRVGTMDEKKLMFLAFTNPSLEFKSTKRGALETDIETAAQQCARVSVNVKARQNRIKEKAIELLDLKIKKNELFFNSIIFLSIDEEDNVPQELTGLIAQHFVSKYNKPCLIGRAADHGFIKGSIRNNENFKSVPELKSFLDNSNLMDYVRGQLVAFNTLSA